VEFGIQVLFFERLHSIPETSQRTLEVPSGHSQQTVRQAVSG
jgi:hypothetical protein